MRASQLGTFCIFGCWFAMSCASSSHLRGAGWLEERSALHESQKQLQLVRSGLQASERESAHSLLESDQTKRDLQLERKALQVSRLLDFFCARIKPLAPCLHVRREFSTQWFVLT